MSFEKLLQAMCPEHQWVRRIDPVGDLRIVQCSRCNVIDWKRSKDEIRVARERKETRRRGR